MIPQYFVMLGGGVDDAGAHFGRIAAKLPVRRLPLALERLIALYRSEGRPAEPAQAFFRRVEIDRVQALLADLEILRLEDASPEDFVDVGDDAAFKIETLDGECSA